MAPTQITDDYYAILEISHTADVISIKSSYKRLARIKHPDKNPTNPNATSEFQLLQEAYSTKYDPESRWRYDIQYASIKGAQQAKPKTTTTEAPQQHSSLENRNTEGKESEKKQRAALREEKLQKLNSRRARQNSEVFDGKRVINKLQGELSKLKEDTDKDAREQAAKGSWWGYLGSYMTGKAGETEEEKAERERRQFDRRAAQTIKEKLLEQQKTEVRNLETGSRVTDGEIRRIRLEIQEEKDEDERVRQREAQKKQAEAAEKRRAEQEKIRREYDIRMAKERRRYAAEAKEQSRRQQAQAEEEEKRKRNVEEKSRQAAMRTRTQSATSRSTSTMASCDHEAWWRWVEGRHPCSNCLTVTRCFAFQCPACNKVACASCRDILKVTRSTQFGSRNFRERGDSYESRWSAPAFEDDDNFRDYGD